MAYDPVEARDTHGLGELPLAVTFAPPSVDRSATAATLSHVADVVGVSTFDQVEGVAAGSVIASVPDERRRPMSVSEEEASKPREHFHRQLEAWRAEKKLTPAEVDRIRAVESRLRLRSRFGGDHAAYLGAMDRMARREKLSKAQRDAVAKALNVVGGTYEGRILGYWTQSKV